MVEGFKHTEIGFYPVDWVEDKLENLITILTDFTANGSFASLAQNVKYLDKPDYARLVRLTDIRASFKNDAIYISKEAYNFLAKSKLYGNELLLANVGAYAGYSFLYPIGLPFKGSLGPNMFLIKFNEKVINPQFAFLSFVSLAILKQLLSKSASSAQPKLNKQNVRECLICYPSDIIEQTAIATALNDADLLINQLEKLLTKKQNIKTGAMQELLKPKEGWEVKKLGEVVNKFVNGGTPSTTIAKYWLGHIPWVSGADILNQKIGQIRRYITVEAVKNSSTNVIEKGNLLFVSRTGVGKLAIAPFDIAISQDFTGIYLNASILIPEFLYRYFDSISEELQNQNQGTSIKGVTRESLFNFLIPIPPLETQTHIIQILSDMDNEIQELEKKIAKYKMLKQGMMQSLLTGKIRLV